ncbi:hypothetical protein GIB67_038652 [Kingdonia uniflora]|uniref:Uncharacterized protein n=1 Tax=Kingdonia uniflora TaxID=39325 RepID=A0A7J7NPP0_9MAGN|nr:hypothetical protein GIB67_038652 [Kingdonia uniflora]
MAVEAVVSIIVEKLVDLLIQEAFFLSSVKGKLEWTVDKLRQIKCYLKGADAREGDENVKNWVNDLRVLAFDAEDVRNKISDISERQTRYGIENIASEAGQSSKSTSERLSLYRQASHDLDEHDIIGFGEDINVLTTRLIEQLLRRCVISIVAMGGSRKSTLADKVYNFDALKNHFKARAWINVSQVYDPQVFLQDLTKEFMNLKSKDSRKMTVKELKELVCEFLIGKTYLVVMDDVWKSDVWKVLKASLRDIKNGSRIIITTRIMKVAL